MVMPINLRGEGTALGGNHFTPARFLVPPQIADPEERMRALGELARAARDEPAVALTDALARCSTSCRPGSRPRSSGPCSRGPTS